MSATRLVIAALLADVDVTAEVDDRVFAVRAPQTAERPLLVVTLLSEDEDQLLIGAGGIFEARVAVACHAGRIAEADYIGEIVKAGLGNLNGEVFEGVGELTSWKAGGDHVTWSDDFTVFRRTIDFICRWQA